MRTMTDIFLSALGARGATGLNVSLMLISADAGRGLCLLLLLLAAGGAAGRVCYAWAAAWLRRRNSDWLLPRACLKPELAGGLLLLSLALCGAPDGAWCKRAALCFLLLTAAWIDRRSLLIPDRLIAAGLLLYLPLSLPEGRPPAALLAAGAANGALVAGALWLFAAAASRLLGRTAMGGGDIKLFFLLGVYLGAAQAFLTLLGASVLGLLLQGGPRAARGTPIPFGPPVAVAAWLAVLWGEPLLDCYRRLLL